METYACTSARVLERGSRGKENSLTSHSSRQSTPPGFRQLQRRQNDVRMSAPGTSREDTKVKADRWISPTRAAKSGTNGEMIPV